MWLSDTLWSQHASYCTHTHTHTHSLTHIHTHHTHTLTHIHTLTHSLTHTHTHTHSHTHTHTHTHSLTHTHTHTLTHTHTHTHSHTHTHTHTHSLTHTHTGSSSSASSSDDEVKEAFEDYTRRQVHTTFSRDMKGTLPWTMSINRPIKVLPVGCRKRSPKYFAQMSASSLERPFLDFNKMQHSKRAVMVRMTL